MYTSTNVEEIELELRNEKIKIEATMDAVEKKKLRQKLAKKCIQKINELAELCIHENVDNNRKYMPLIPVYFEYLDKRTFPADATTSVAKERNIDVTKLIEAYAQTYHWLELMIISILPLNGEGFTINSEGYTSIFNFEEMKKVKKTLDDGWKLVKKYYEPEESMYRNFQYNTVLFERLEAQLKFIEGSREPINKKKIDQALSILENLVDDDKLNSKYAKIKFSYDPKTKKSSHYSETNELLMRIKAPLSRISIYVQLAEMYRKLDYYTYAKKAYTEVLNSGLFGDLGWINEQIQILNNKIAANQKPSQ